MWAVQKAQRYFWVMVLHITPLCSEQQCRLPPAQPNARCLPEAPPCRHQGLKADGRDTHIKPRQNSIFFSFSYKNICK